MVDIDEILDMLDDRNPSQVQSRGIVLAESISALDALIMPYEGVGEKHQWENCARVLCEHSDYVIRRYAYKLLRWLRDMDVPGAERIKQRLLRMGNKEQLLSAVKAAIREARSIGNKLWLEVLYELQEACSRPRREETRYTIDDIYAMLSWYSSTEDQKTGLEQAATVKNLYLFLRPCGKDVWENCAEVLSCHTDEELMPYLADLFAWVGDLNWPGAECIQERLKQFKDKVLLRQLMDQIDRDYARAAREDRWEIDRMLSNLEYVLS